MAESLGTLEAILFSDEDRKFYLFISLCGIVNIKKS